MGNRCPDIWHVDVTDDVTEPDISALESSDLHEMDSYIQIETAKALIEQKMEIVTWVGSKLYEAGGLKCLVSTYSVLDQGIIRQIIVHRLYIKGHKMVVMGCYDIERQDILAEPIYEALQNMTVDQI